MRRREGESWGAALGTWFSGTFAEQSQRVWTAKKESAQLADATNRDMAQCHQNDTFFPACGLGLPGLENQHLTNPTLSVTQSIMGLYIWRIERSSPKQICLVMQQTYIHPCGPFELKTN